MIREVQELGSAPGARVAALIRMPVVENFTDAAGGVAVLLHPAWESSRSRHQLTKMRAIDIESQSVRTQAGEH